MGEALTICISSKFPGAVADACRPTNHTLWEPQPGSSKNTQVFGGGNMTALELQSLERVRV